MLIKFEIYKSYYYPPPPLFLLFQPYDPPVEDTIQSKPRGTATNSKEALTEKEDLSNLKIKHKDLKFIEFKPISITEDMRDKDVAQAFQS